MLLFLYLVIVVQFYIGRLGLENVSLNPIQLSHMY
jgi:hypothetical protein